MQESDRAFTEWPFLGLRQMRDYLALLGYGVGRKRLRRLMRLMGLEPIYQRPRTSTPHPEHKHYPYLLRELVITPPNHTCPNDGDHLCLRRAEWDGCLAQAFLFPAEGTSAPPPAGPHGYAARPI